MRHERTGRGAASVWQLLEVGLIGCALVVACGSCGGGGTPGGSTGGGEPYQHVAGGEADRGKVAIRSLGCGACHVIPGIADAQGTVGPPLSAFGRRAFIAGEVPNTSASLVQWIEAPQSIEPATAMPNLGVSESQARDIAAYLYTLR